MEYRPIHEILSISEQSAYIFLQRRLNKEIVIPCNHKIITFVYEFIDTPSYIYISNDELKCRKILRLPTDFSVEFRWLYPEIRVFIAYLRSRMTSGLFCHARTTRKSA